MEIGIPKLDEFLKGGLPTGKTLLYYIEPGVEGEVFGMQTVYQNLKKGRNAIYITSASDPESVRGYFREFGWDIDSFEKEFAILDAYSGLVGMDSKERYVVKDPSDLNEIDAVFKKALEEAGAGSIVAGSLSTIMDVNGEEKTLEHIERWNKLIMVNDCVGLFNFTSWPYSKETTEKIEEETFNGVIKVTGIGERIVFGQYYAVVKADWTEVPKKTIVFRVKRPGGVKAFIPKILITGPYNSGKSSFIKALSTRAVSADRLGTTVAMDHGHVEHKGFSADIFGTPGQERFDPILKLLGGQAMGAFLIVDSTKPEEFVRAKKMVTVTETFGLPYVIIANKQDLEGALSVDEVRDAMKMPEDVPIIPTVATEGKGMSEAFETLAELITGAED